MKFAIPVLVVALIAAGLFGLNAFLGEETQDFATGRADEPALDEAVGPRRSELETRSPVDTEVMVPVADEPATDDEGPDLPLLVSGYVVDTQGSPVENPILSLEGLRVQETGRFAGGVLMQSIKRLERIKNGPVGHFEMRGLTDAKELRLTVSKSLAKPVVLTVPVGSTGLRIEVTGESYLKFRLIAEAPTELDDLVIKLRSSSKMAVPQTGRKNGVVDVEMAVLPGRYDLKILDALGDPPLHEAGVINLEPGETHDYGVISVRSLAVEVDIALEFPDELVGSVGLLETVEGDDLRVLRKSDIRLEKSGQRLSMILRELPTELRAVFSRTRTLVYRLNAKSVTLALQAGIERSFILQSSMALPEGVKLIFRLRNPLLKIPADQITIEQGSGPQRFLVSDYGRHVLSLSVQVPKPDAIDRILDIALPGNQAEFSIERDDLSPIRFTIDADLERVIRERIESVR